MVTTAWALSGPISIIPGARIFTSLTIPLPAFSTKISAMENSRRLDLSPALRSVKTVPNKPPWALPSAITSIYTTNFSDEYDDLYRNDGNWNFTDVSYQSGIALPSLPYVKWGTAFADFDNDGWLDLIAVSGHVYPQVDSLPSGGGYREPKLFHLNQADGTFCDASDLAGPALQERHVSRCLAVGDLFNDGNVDVVVGDLDGAPMILRNHGVPGHNWVSFDLAGTKSNRMAIGAKVKLVAGGITQTDEVHSGGSYLSQSDTRLHFGLGSAKKLDHVEIRWPSGAVETLDGLDADQFYSVLEGSGVVLASRIRPAAPKGSR